MKVNLEYGYYFNLTDNSFDAYYQPPKKEDAENDPTPQLIGHYSNFENMLKRITQHYSTRQDGEMDIREFLMRWRATYEVFAGILRDHKIV